MAKFIRDNVEWVGVVLVISALAVMASLIV